MLARLVVLLSCSPSRVSCLLLDYCASPASKLIPGRARGIPVSPAFRTVALHELVFQRCACAICCVCSPKTIQLVAPRQRSHIELLGVGHNIILILVQIDPIAECKPEMPTITPPSTSNILLLFRRLRHVLSAVLEALMVIVDPHLGEGEAHMRAKKQEVYGGGLPNPIKLRIILHPDSWGLARVIMGATVMVRRWEVMPHTHTRMSKMGSPNLKKISPALVLRPAAV